jgi:hypothetical protein
MAQAYETASKMDFLNLPPVFSAYINMDISLNLKRMKLNFV